jgi:hypothetical protein
MKLRILLTAGAAGLVCAHALAATPPAATGPWAKVPALPTACYSSQDQWMDQNGAAIDAVQEMLYAQQAANTEVEQAANRAMSEDPMAMMQAMQQAMLDDPANAQKMIEKMNQTGEQARDEVPAQQEKEKQIEAESKSVLQKYEAALGKSMQPSVARWNALQKKMGYEVDPQFPIGPDPSWPSWAWQEWAGIQKDRDAAYVANCAQWWSATGGIQAYMTRYKDYLVQERIPYEKKLIDEARLNNFKMLGVSAEGYRTTTDIEAAIDYMKMASSLYGQRMDNPFCYVLNACD